MLIPIGLDHPQKKFPAANSVFIFINIIVLLMTPTEPLRWINFIHRFGLRADSPDYFQFLTHMFTHSSWLHLLGNLIFLVVFGNHVNRVLGNLHYAIAYLLLGFISGLGHVLLTDGIVPLVGASGAINGVTGMFIALHGRDKVKILLWLGVPLFVFRLPSMLFLLIWFSIDLYYALSFSPEELVTAHWVHIVGCVGGFSYILWLMLSEFIARSEFDILSFFLFPFPGKQTPTIIASAPTLLPSKIIRDYTQTLFSDNDPATQSQVTPSILLEGLTNDQIKYSIQKAIADKNDNTAMTTYYKTRTQTPQLKLDESDYAHIAQAFLKSDHVKEAIQTYQSLLTQYPNTTNTAQFYFTLGTLYQQHLLDIAKAHHCFQKCLDHSPNKSLQQQSIAAINHLSDTT